MRPDVQIGAPFPDYELPDHTGRRRKLSDLQGIDPMILVLSRGHYCPKDRRQIRPDWDITTPELRDAWARDSRRTELFYPYGKTMAEVFKSSG